MEQSKNIIKLQQEIINKQNEIIKTTEDEFNEFKQKQRYIINEFNNLPSGEELYEKDLREKGDLHKYRIKQYNQFIYKNGMQSFAYFLIKAHDGLPYLQNFREFINFCSKDLQEKIEIEIARREFEMTKSIYMDFMPLLDTEKVINHMIYLDEEFGEALNNLDELTK